MALIPNNTQHALQIQAGIMGRLEGHKFEVKLAISLNNIKEKILQKPLPEHLIYDKPEIAIVKKALQLINWDTFEKIDAIALGTLATAEDGKKWLEVNGLKVKACKSDILLNLYDKKGDLQSVGISVKQCGKKSPTNAQLYFTTARAFCELLNKNNIKVSEKGILALRQFCGDLGYRPLDNENSMKNRKSDPRRYFWEEINKDGREDLENIFSKFQDKITTLLLQKAYLDDPFPPQILLHLTKKPEANLPQEFALYTIEELVKLSSKYSGFEKKKYSVRKGSYKDPEGVLHDAPRFGIVQMQRGGQKQHPEQLQFNLQAGYFYNI